MPLDSDFASAFQFCFVLFYPPLGGTGWLNGTRVEFFLSTGQPGLDKTPEVRFWLNTFSRGQTLLRRTKCSGIFQNDSFSPPLERSMRGFIYTHCEDLGHDRAPGNKSHEDGRVCRIWLGPLNIFWWHVGWFPNQRLNLGFCNESVKTPNPNHWVTRELPSFPTF